MGNGILLSICIPTYNRSVYLKNTLDSIVSNKAFSEDTVEVVISDNCSTDNTEMVVATYTKRYANIKYYRNNTNIADKNFPLVLSKASGVLKKLCNDTLLFTDDSISYLLHVARTLQGEKPVIFTTNKGDLDDKKVTSLEDFLYDINFYVTWIGGVCIWDDDWNSFGNTEEGCEERLWQVPFLLHYVESRKNVYISHKKLFVVQQVQKKDISYGLYKVFYVNYLKFVREKQETHAISEKCYDWLEKDLLFNFFLGWLMDYEKKQYLYSQSEDLFLSVKQAYKNKPYYIKFIMAFYYRKIKRLMKTSIMTLLKNIRT